MLPHKPDNITLKVNCDLVIVLILFWSPGVGTGNGKDLRFEVIINGSIVYNLACTGGRPGQVRRFKLILI